MKLSSWRWLVADRIRLIIPNIMHLLLFPIANLIFFVSPKKGLEISMRMNRYTDHNKWDDIICKNIDTLIVNSQSMIPKLSEVKKNEDLSVSRSIFLKIPIKHGGEVIEKGVLIVTFTPTFNYYLRAIDIDRLLDDFFLVLEPSWAGYCEPSILQWIQFKEHDIIVQSTEPKDRIFLNSLAKNLVPVTFGASDWVDFRIFHPIEGVEKYYDSIYVTSYKPGKRHHVYFRAIAAINDPLYRGAIACGAWGESKEDVLNLIKYYGVEDNIDIYESLAPDDLNMLLNKSKVNVLFSKKEGSNRSVFEGLYANVPAIILKNNIGMNKSYINKNTGIIANEDEVHEHLVYFKKNWKKYQPRQWAMENISPLKTADKLNAILKKKSIEQGHHWSKDIVAKVNSPEVQYFSKKDSDSFPPVRDVLREYML